MGFLPATKTRKCMICFDCVYEFRHAKCHSTSKRARYYLTAVKMGVLRDRWYAIYEETYDWLKWYSWQLAT